jgi:hypothetical protein
MHHASLARRQGGREDESLARHVITEEKKLRIELKGLWIVQVDIYRKSKTFFNTALGVKVSHNSPGFPVDRDETGEGEVAGTAEDNEETEV